MAKSKSNKGKVKVPTKAQAQAFIAEGKAKVEGQRREARLYGLRDNKR